MDTNPYHILPNHVINKMKEIPIHIYDNKNENLRHIESSIKTTTWTKLTKITPHPKALFLVSIWHYLIPKIKIFA